METTMSNKMATLDMKDSINEKDLKMKSSSNVKSGVSWDELIERLLEIFDSDEVNIEEVESLLCSYKSSPRDWSKFAKFDKYRYTRNLVHEGNGKFNLMLLCWAEGNQSTIHDHSDAHCFVKVLDGGITETRFDWPSPGEESLPLREIEVADCKTDAVSYMSDELGLHRVENKSHSSKAVSLHLYSPPFKTCNMFDQNTGKKTNCKMTFWSKFGERLPSVKPTSKNQPRCDC